jgi:hypothetical protein
MRYLPPSEWRWERLGAVGVTLALFAIWFLGVSYATGPTP